MPCPWDQWNVGQHALKPGHNWSRVFGTKKPVLADIKPHLDDVLKNGTWTKIGDATGPVGKVIGEILEAQHNGVWVRAFKDPSGKIIVNKWRRPMTVATLDHAQSLIEAGDYDSAVNALKLIANDSACDKSTRADAFHALGTMTQVDPTSVGDDCALPFYKRALELCPNHLWAMYGIVTTFGDHAPDHQDADAFARAIQRLLPRLDELDPSAAETVQRKHEQFKSHP